MAHSETAKVRPYVWPWIKEGRGIDLGCGFDKVHPECVGMDCLDGSADVGGDIADLSRWDDGHFDWAFSSHAVEDMPDTGAAVAEWFRVVRPGGHLIVYCPYRHYYPNAGQPGANPDHVHDFVPSDIVGAMHRAEPSVWIVTAEVRGRRRTDEFHEYSCLVVARKGRPEKPAVLIENNHQIGDTLSAAPLCGILRDVLPGCEITAAIDKAGVLEGIVDRVGREGRAYDLIVHQKTSATERGDYLRRTVHFTQFTQRVCGEMLPETLEHLPEDPAEPVTLPYAVSADDEYPGLPDGFVALVPETHPPRQWPHHRWSRLADWLLECGFPVVVLGTDASAGEFDPRVADLRGRTSFRQSAAVVAAAGLVVGIDTSLIHIAHCVGVRAVVLMGPSKFETTFYRDTVPVWRRDRRCVGCYNWTDAGRPWEWDEGRPKVGVSGSSLPEGTQMEMYALDGCRNFMAGVECMAAVQLSDVKVAVGELLGIATRKKQLTATYIVRNEEENLPRSLDTVVGLADAVVVVDTGSGDRTIEVAREWGGRTGIPLEIVHFTWRDDFAAAKNEALRYVETEYFLWLDADDLVGDPSGIRDFFNSTSHDVYQMWTDVGASRFLRERIAPTSANWLYPVHECLDIGGLDTVDTDFVVRHRPADPDHWKGSLERNERILSSWLEREPESDRATFYLAETYRQREQWERAVPLYRRHCERGTDWYENTFQSAYQVARYHLHIRDWKGAARWGMRAIHIDPVWREGYYAVGDAYFWMGHHRVAYAWFLAAHNLPRPDRRLWKEESIYGHLCMTQLSYCCERLGKLGEAIMWAEQAAGSGGSRTRAEELRHPPPAGGQDGDTSTLSCFDSPG